MISNILSCYLVNCISSQKSISNTVCIMYVIFVCYAMHVHLSDANKATCLLSYYIELDLRAEVTSNSMLTDSMKEDLN